MELQSKIAIISLFLPLYLSFGWMASPTRWAWVWVNSGSWWWTGWPGVLQFMESQRAGHDWATELISLYWRSLFLHMISRYHLSFFHLPKSISYKAGLMVMNYLSFCLPGEVLISHSLCRIILLDMKFLVCRCFFFFPFQHCKYVILLPSGFKGFWLEISW